MYGARSIFLLFCDNQDTKSESRGVEIGVDGLIFTLKNIKVPMGQWYPYPTRWEKNVVAIIHIYGVEAIFLIFYDNQATESE